MRRKMGADCSDADGWAASWMAEVTRLFQENKALRDDGGDLGLRWLAGLSWTLSLSSCQCRFECLVLGLSLSTWQ
jgi:hypothetical protein